VRNVNMMQQTYSSAVYCGLATCVGVASKTLVMVTGTNKGALAWALDMIGNAMHNQRDIRALRDSVDMAQDAWDSTFTSAGNLNVPGYTTPADHGISNNGLYAPSLYTLTDMTKRKQVRETKKENEA
jgi:hypothetical protein